MRAKEKMNNCNSCDHLIGYGEYFVGTYKDDEEILSVLDHQNNLKHHEDMTKDHMTKDDESYFFTRFNYCPLCGIGMLGIAK